MRDKKWARAQRMLVRPSHRAPESQSIHGHCLIAAISMGADLATSASDRPQETRHTKTLPFASTNSTRASIQPNYTALISPIIVIFFGQTAPPATSRLYLILFYSYYTPNPPIPRRFSRHTLSADNHSEHPINYLTLPRQKGHFDFAMMATCATR